MRTACYLATIVAIGFGAGFMLQERAASAAVPPACPQYQCKVLQCYWAGGANTVIEIRTLGGGAVSDSAFVNIFASFSIGNLPSAPNGGYDDYTYNSCTPLCGKDAAGVWQATQVVTPLGPKVLLSANNNRFRCSVLREGQLDGDKNTDPTNDNPNHNNPPGRGPDGDPVISP